MKSLLLVDAILLTLASLEPGERTTARKVARLVGEGQTRVEAELARLADSGAVRARTVWPTTRPNAMPYELYTVDHEAVERLITKRNGKQC